MGLGRWQDVGMEGWGDGGLRGWVGWRDGGMGLNVAGSWCLRNPYFGLPKIKKQTGFPFFCTKIGTILYFCLYVVLM